MSLHGNIPEDVDIYMINRERSVAVLTDGAVVPVTHWFDRRGDDCEPVCAVTCVAGSEARGWFVVDLEQYRYVVVH